MLIGQGVCMTGKTVLAHEKTEALLLVDRKPIRAVGINVLERVANAK